ncbi:MAG: phosphoglycerate mutase (2,3-diphosphoglycerate-independent), partial [Lachnospiraceae bacterium]|nr:phosphoglycerate mutase (2,3-diphosphoglycerate-independent) [Lachnospiraceae bacterium]
MANTHGGAALAAAVEKAYQAGQDDYHLEPMSLLDAEGAPVGKIHDGDEAVFCCRRGEREIQLTEAFTEADFKGFSRDFMQDVRFVIMTMYHEKFKNLPIAFAPEKVKTPLAEVISSAGLTQFHASESEKYAHVTFFFNGGV